MRGDEVAPARPAVVRVATAASARAHARAVVDAHWGDRGRPVREQDVIDLLLVVSELVTNAIRHGGGLAGFEVTPVPEGLRLAVHDHSDVVPAVAYGSGELPAGHHGNGYGWPLIIRLSREITVRRRPGGGKTIRVLVPLSLTTAERREPLSPPRRAPR
ncbi:ATP-binding protein [Streptomyces sp. NPDC000345]|uniref:ATP-binding protein n=1 Tax=Streptomyces sp. NPDC000345 TaxID=3364537 RepID=UPI0036991C1F